MPRILVSNTQDQEEGGRTGRSNNSIHSSKLADDHLKRRFHRVLFGNVACKPKNGQILLLAALLYGRVSW